MNKNQNLPVLITTIPTQKNILEIIKNNVSFIADVSNVIVGKASNIKINISSIKTFNEQLEHIYGEGGLFYKIEYINQQLGKAKDFKKNIFKQRDFKIQLLEITSIFKYVEKLAEAASAINNSVFDSAIEVIDKIGNIILGINNILDNIKFQPLAPIKIGIMNIAFGMFIKGICSIVDYIFSSDYGPAGIISTLYMLDRAIMPLMNSLIHQIDDVGLIKYMVIGVKLNFLNDICKDFGEMIQFIAELSNNIKGLEFKDMAIFGLASACIQGISYTLGFVETLDLLPTEAIKLHFLNKYTLPGLLNTFDTLMLYFNPQYNNGNTTKNDNIIFSRKEPWPFKAYFNTIKGIGMMLLTFKALDLIKDTISIVNTFISAKLGIWNKLQNGVIKMIQIFEYIMCYFNPEYNTGRTTKNGKTIFARKQAWTNKMYFRTIKGLAFMVIIYGLLEHIMKYATIAALLSVPFSICAIPFMFSLVILFTITKLIIKQTSVISVKHILKMLIITVITAILAFIGMELFVLSLVALRVLKNFHWISLLLLSIMAVIFMVIPLCLAGALLTLIGPLAIAGLFSLVAVMTAITAIAIKLRILQTIELDRTIIINNVDAVLTTARYIIDMLFTGEKAENFEDVSDSSSWLGLFFNIGKGSGDLIKSIAASGILFMTLISVSLILLTLGVLIYMQETIKSINKSNILIAVDTVLKISDFIVKAIFNNAEYDSLNDKVNRTEQYKNSNFIQRVFRGIGDLITMMAASTMLMMSALSIGAITLIVSMFKTIENASFNETTIQDNVAKVINLCKLVIDTVNAPSETKEENKKDGIIGKALSVLLPSNLKYALDAIVSMPFIALTWLSISMIKGMIDGLKEIENFPELKNINTNVNNIITICKNIIETVNKQDFELEEITKNNKIVRKLKKLIKNIISISELETKDLTSTIKNISSNLKSFRTYIIPELNKLPRIDDSRELLISLKDVNRIVKVLYEFADIKLDKTISGMTGFVDFTDIIIEKVSNNKNITRKRRFEDSLENVSRYSTILRKITSLISLNASEFGSVNLQKHSEFIETNIKFLEKINEIDSSKLKKTANLYKQLRHFSESINGNFDKLVEALGEKLLPVLTELKEIMSEVPGKLDIGFQNTSASIAATNAAPTKENVAAQVSRENPNLSRSDVDAIVAARLNERARTEANGMSAKLDELISLLKGLSGENVIVKTV